MSQFPFLYNGWTLVTYLLYNLIPIYPPPPPPPMSQTFTHPPNFNFLKYLRYIFSISFSFFTLFDSKPKETFCLIGSVSWRPLSNNPISGIPCYFIQYNRKNCPLFDFHAEYFHSCIHGTLWPCDLIHKVYTANNIDTPLSGHCLVVQHWCKKHIQILVSTYNEISKPLL
jgi:hypothetical protein